MKKKIVFLDLNGNIVDDWDASYVGVCANFRKYGKPEPTLEGYIRGVAKNGDYKQFYEDGGIVVPRDELRETFLQAYIAHTCNFTRIRTFPGVHTTLQTLRENGIEIHILSAALEDIVMGIIEAIGIRKYCASFHCHVHNKEAQIHAIIDGMDVRPEECAMMGDLPSDVIHARGAGIKGVGFTNPDVPRDLWTDVDVNFMALSFAGVLDFVL